jgi:basic membrane protein A
LLPNRNAWKVAGRVHTDKVASTTIPSVTRGFSGGTLKKSIKLLAIIAATALVGGVAVAPASQAAKIKTCLALDTGGVDDHSFNAAAWAGAQASTVSTAEYLPATSSADFAPNIKKFVDKKCNLIIGVGFSISGEIVKSAKLNPGIKYAVVDDQAWDHGDDGSQWPGKPVANVKGLTFSTDEPSFMAGYAAAGYSKTGKVATYGGAPYPTVTIFMDGFAKGVAYYNKKHGKSVQVLGWDPAKPTAGTFVGNFNDMNKALTISTGFEQQGADVIFPVAGGLGGATAGNSLKNHKSVTIWVDSDGYDLVPQYRSVLLTSVVKGIGNAVKSVAADVAGNKFTNDSYVGTLANRGVLLASYHDLSSKVPALLQSEVRKIGNDIASGKQKIN